jgi:hypothetical protein
MKEQPIIQGKRYKKGVKKSKERPNLKINFFATFLK